jgi:hypothetical protein
MEGDCGFSRTDACDGVKKFSTFGSNTLNTKIDLPSGLHQFTYYLIGADGSKISESVNVTAK